MRKFLSVILSLVIILNCGFSTIKATNTEGNDGQTGTTEVTASSNIEITDTDGSGFDSPVISSEEVETGKQIVNDSNVEYADSDIVRVSIVLNSNSTLEKYPTEDIASNKKAMDYRAKLEKEQAKVVKKIEKKLGETLDVKWNLTLAANIISAEVKYGDLEKILKVANVKEVWIEQQYYPEDDTNTTITTSEMVYATYAWANGYTGAGQLVAIIDTGTNQDHLSFSGDALSYSLTKDGKSLSDYDLLTKEDVKDVSKQLNAYKRMNESFDVNSSYKSLKIPYSFNYVDNNYTTDHSSDKQGEHGSHVSGIAAANRYVKVDGEYVEAATKVYAVGVAPDAQILTMKVFGANGGAYDSDYMAAIEDSIVLGADSCNLSLGSSAAGFSFSQGYQQIMDKLVANNTVVTISAGNSYSFSSYAENGLGGYLYGDDINFATGGSPGTFVNSLAVASADNIGVTGTPLVFNGSLKAFYAETTGYKNQSILTVTGDYDYVYVDGIGTEEQFAAVNAQISLEGKVVICNRGTISFYVKGDNAAKYNPKAIICANNASGVINMDLSTYGSTIPFVSITLDDANKIKADSSKTTVGDINVYTGKVTISNVISADVVTTRDEATISEFSSWGIPGSLIMKPEITAPGGSIYSVNGMTDDGYEEMSGTSMAAPHTAGMAAILSQYIKENNLTEKLSMTQRAIINSLLMSTATVMFDEYGDYYPILQQGSGLADVFAATSSSSIITMNEDATSSYADGKVKVEFGDDPSKSGIYTYSFNITNFSDNDLTYRLSTDIFTQAFYTYYDDVYLTPYTVGVDAKVTYEFDLEQHDVDKDGDTDTDDVQALLDYLTGVVDGSSLDLEAGEMDGVEAISSYDAQLLLEWLENTATDVFVAAGQSKTIKVTISLDSSDKRVLDYYLKNGAYVEGFTYVDCLTTTDDGEYLDVLKSIPLIGFYGNYSDASMFDTSVVEQYYEYQSPYSGVTSNYMTMQYSDSDYTSYMIGNPYYIEDSFPVERLAISSDTVIKDFKYSLIRNAGTVGAFAYKVNDEGQFTDKLYSDGFKNNVYSQFYYSRSGGWSNTTPNTVNVSSSVKSLGLSENDKFNIGVFAVAEYYAMDSKGILTEAELEKLVKSSTLGAGAELGYTFTVDDSKPVVKSVVLSEDQKTLTVTVSDNRYVAYVALMDLNGEDVYAGTLPKQTEPGQDCTVEFDMTTIKSKNAFALFVGDYAANETYKVVKVKDGDPTATRYAYVLTDKLEAGRDYIIVNSNTAGSAKALKSEGIQYYTDIETVSIVEKGTRKYIPLTEASNEILWTATQESNGISFVSKQYKQHLSFVQDAYPPVTYTWENYDADVWTYSNNLLVTGNYKLVYINAYSKFVTIDLATTEDYMSPVYLYTLGEYEEVVDTENVSKVTISPSATTLILGISETAQLKANVEPFYINDKSVTWSSSNEEVATVDQDGNVKAVSVGQTTIKAVSNLTNTVYGTATVSVVISQPMDAKINGVVQYGSDVQFVTIDLKNMSTTKLGSGLEDYPILGGGRDGNYIYGADVDMDMHAYDITNDYKYEALGTFTESYSPLDGANFPAMKNSGVTADYDLAGVTVANYLAFYDLNKGSVSYFDIGNKHDQAVAICYIGSAKDLSGNIRNYYYLLTDSGQLWVWGVYNTATGLSGGFGQVANISTLTTDGEKHAYSMVYALEITGKDSVFISDDTTRSIYYLEIPSSNDVVNINAKYIGSVNADYLGTLYNDEYDKFASTSAVRDNLEALMTNTVDSIQAKLYTNTVESVAGVSSEITAPKVASFMDQIFNKSSVAFNEEVETEEQVTVEYSQDVDTKNGLVAVSYDPEEVEFLGVETVSEYYSVYDDENGTVTFAYAQTEAIEANSTIAQFFFSKPCEDSTLTFTTKEVNDSLNENDEVTLTEEGVGHIWEFVGFEWNEDYSEAKAKFVCTRNENHTKLVDAEVTSEITKKPTYESEGEKTVKAHVVFEEKEYEETKTVSIAKLRPDTGDHSNIVLWTSVTTVSLLAVVVATLLKKKYAVK